MKKNHAFILAMIMIPLLIASCRIVEVSSMPRTVTITILSDSPAPYQLCQLKSSGKFEPVKPVKPGIFSISIPAMDGGYSEILFIKYNKHIPEEYPIIQVTKSGKILKELSIRDIEKLPVLDGSIQLKPE